MGCIQSACGAFHFTDQKVISIEGNRTHLHRVFGNSELINRIMCTNSGSQGDMERETLSDLVTILEKQTLWSLKK